MEIRFDVKKRNQRKRDRNARMNCEDLSIGMEQVKKKKLSFFYSFTLTNLYDSNAMAL